MIIETFIEELNYILDGGFRQGDNIVVKFPSTSYDGMITFALMGKNTYNVLVTFREGWNTIEQKLRRYRVPHKIDLVIDAFSKSNRIDYQDDRVIFIDSPSLLNDISYEYNSVLSKLESPVFLNILTTDSGLEKNEINSFSKFLEVMLSRTVVKGVFMVSGEKDIMKNRNFTMEITVDKDEHILRSKQMLSEIFFKTEPVFKIL
ncbi:MAG: hypothetical protein QXI75_02115 [Candidatus Anstonellales archaeon]